MTEKPPCMVHSHKTLKFQYNYVAYEHNAVVQETLRCQMSVLPAHSQHLGNTAAAQLVGEVLRG